MGRVDGQERDLNICKIAQACSKRAARELPEASQPEAKLLIHLPPLYTIQKPSTAIVIATSWSPLQQGRARAKNIPILRVLFRSRGRHACSHEIRFIRSPCTPDFHPCVIGG